MKKVCIIARKNDIYSLPWLTTRRTETHTRSGINRKPRRVGTGEAYPARRCSRNRNVIGNGRLSCQGRRDLKTDRASRAKESCNRTGLGRRTGSAIGRRGDEGDSDVLLWNQPARKARPDHLYQLHIRLSGARGSSGVELHLRFSGCNGQEQNKSQCQQPTICLSRIREPYLLDRRIRHCGLLACGSRETKARETHPRNSRFINSCY